MSSHLVNQLRSRIITLLSWLEKQARQKCWHQDVTLVLEPGQFNQYAQLLHQRKNKRLGLDLATCKIYLQEERKRIHPALASQLS